MPIFKNHAAVTSMIDLMAAYIEVLYPNADVIAGMSKSLQFKKWFTYLAGWLIFIKILI